MRWHRCLRCDSWLPLPPPESRRARAPPDRDEIELPLRGRPLRDKIVLRLIAIDRALHFLVPRPARPSRSSLFAATTPTCATPFYRVVADLSGGVGAGGPRHRRDRCTSRPAVLARQLDAAARRRRSSLVYALVEGVEAVGLWREALGRVPDAARHRVAAAARGLRAGRPGHAVQGLALSSTSRSSSTCSTPSACSACAAAPRPTRRCASATSAGRRSRRHAGAARGLTRPLPARPALGDDEPVRTIPVIALLFLALAAPAAAQPVRSWVTAELGEQQTSAHFAVH